MAQNTWVALDTVTVVNGSTNTIQFSNIPNTYKNLVVVANLRSSDSRTGYQSVSYTFNGTTSGYGATVLYGNGTNALSYNQNNAGVFEGLCFMNGGNANRFYNNTLNIMDYSNTSKWKSVLIDMSDSNLGAYKSAGTWRNTAAISSIQITEASNLPWVQGSSATLYGLGSWSNTEASPKATGGYVSSDANYWYHAFPFSSTFTPSQSLTADVLVVAGGGSGGGYFGGGGGAGGLLYFGSQSLSATTYNCTVGAGGARPTATPSSYEGKVGSDSQFGALTLVKGGGGGATGGGQSSSATLNGGSGGGGAGGTQTTGGSPTSGQGNAGGSSAGPVGNYGSGGGGGAGAAGGYGSTNGGNGGNGLSTYSAFGAATGFGHSVDGTYWFAGGGAGAVGTASASIAGVGGLGGGGNGPLGNTAGAIVAPGTNGMPSTGGGGAGGNLGSSGLYGGLQGGSGIIIVRYAK